MSQENIKEIRIQAKVDSVAGWQNYNPVLLDREIGYERETGKYKIGNGISAWNDLKYAGTSVAESALMADYATSAGSAEYANMADNATHAETANQANSADNATYATSASSAEYAISAKQAEQANIANLANDANKLSSEKKIEVNLEQINSNLNPENIQNFDGSKDIVIGVSGTLPVEAGGTGVNNYAELRSKLKPEMATDFATTGGGRFYYVGRQPIPDSEKAFIKPESDPGIYLGQLSDAFGGWYITILFGDNQIIIRKYTIDKIYQDIIKDVSINQYGIMKKCIMDTENGHIFACFYDEVSYPDGIILQFQFEGSEINSSFEKEADIPLPNAIWYDSDWVYPYQRNFSSLCAYNKELYLITNTGRYDGTYNSQSYLRLSKITREGDIVLGPHKSGDIGSLYTNGFDLYWNYQYQDNDKSSSQTYKSILKYPQGDLNAETIIWQNYDDSDYDFTIEYLGKEADKFLIQETSKWTGSRILTYYFVFNNGNQQTISTFYNSFDILYASKNYIVFIMWPTSINLTSGLLTSLSVGLMDFNGTIKFIDSYCNYILSSCRFDEDTNTFYFGTGNGYEFIYTII